MLSIVLGFRYANRLDESKLFKSSDEVLANGGVVFNDISFEFHYQIRCMVYTGAWLPCFHCRRIDGEILTAGIRPVCSLAPTRP